MRRPCRSTAVRKCVVTPSSRQIELVPRDRFTRDVKLDNRPPAIEHRDPLLRLGSSVKTSRLPGSLMSLVAQSFSIFSFSGSRGGAIFARGSSIS